VHIVKCKETLARHFYVPNLIDFAENKPRWGLFSLIRVFEKIHKKNLIFPREVNIVIQIRRKDINCYISKIG